MSLKKIIYQAFPRWFANPQESPVTNGTIADNGVGKFSSFTEKALDEIRKLGVTDIWYTGVIEHATKTDYTSYNIRKDHRAIVKGKAGSPYAIKDYFDVDPDLADSVPDRMGEFEALVRRTHQAGLKVIIDFVPNHVARQYYSDARPPFVEDLGQGDDISAAFSPNNNFYYLPNQTLQLDFGVLQDDFEYSEFPARVTGNNCATTTPGKDDWYETIKLNYGIDYANGGVRHFDPVPDTWTKMLAILEFWVEKGIDGFRCDMAEMVPVEFWNWVIPKVKEGKDVCFIAEVYNPGEYRNYLYSGFFDYLYDKVGLYDTLRNVITGREPATSITRSWQAIDGLQPHLLNFLENHDEQRIASAFFAGNARAGIPGMYVSALINTGPVMIYSGQELGERGMDEEGFSGLDGRTTIFDYWSVDTLRRWYNKGAFNSTRLTPEEQSLRKEYQALLNIARKEPAITDGQFYDLMYANLNNPSFNPNRQFVFLRKYQRDLILITVNFDPVEQDVRINLPPEAFEFLGVVDNKAATVTDLLSGKKGISTLTNAYPYEVKVPGYGASMLKFTYRGR